MATECEMIRQQMKETRTALTDKIELLEHQVVDTVQTACTAISDTVVSVKEIVHDSLQMVNDTVHDTAEKVKDTFDLRRQVDQRPWTMFAGATALGYFGGYLLRGANGRAATMRGNGKGTALETKARPAASHTGARERRDAATRVAMHESDTATFAAADKPNWPSRLGDMFQAETSQLKGLVVGTLLGIVRDIVADAAPEPLKHQVEEIVNGITVKLGGQLQEGHILTGRPRIDGMGKNGKPEDHGSHEPTGSAEFSPTVLASM